jgi:hypothetical protein
VHRFGLGALSLQLPWIDDRLTQDEGMAEFAERGGWFLSAVRENGWVWLLWRGSWFECGCVVVEGKVEKWVDIFDTQSYTTNLP